MMTRPQFRPHFHVQVVDPDQVFLVTEAKTHVLEGKIYQRLAPLLDGERTLDELSLDLADSVNLPELYYALHRLERRGYIVEADPEMGKPAAAWWSALDVAPKEAGERLAATSVSVRGIGGVETAAMAETLRAMGVAVVDDGEVTLVLTDDYAREELDEINRDAIARGRSWMLAKPVGAVVWVGPVFVPGLTACWTCLADRLRRNRQVDMFVQARTGRNTSLGRSHAALPASVQAGVGMAATSLARWIAAGAGVKSDQVIETFDLATFESRTHPVTRRPQCAVCGAPPAMREPEPVILKSSPKTFTGDGGHRVMSPEETYERVKSLVSPITGVVTSLLRKDADDNGVTFSYATGHDFSVVSDDVKVLRANMRYRSGGKGMSDVQARVSGICEAVERYSGVHRGDERVVRASQRELGDAAIRLNDILLFSDGQIAGRHAWNRACSDSYYHVVPEPLAEDTVIDWAPYWSLTGERFRYVPAAFSYYGHPEGQMRFCGADANGTAAGSSREEAVLQGLMELVERDAVAIWWYNRIPRPRVDLDSFDVPYTRTLQAHYAGLGRDLWVIDLTTDLGIPTFAAVSPRLDRPAQDIIVSFGAHWDPTVALTRALTEANQFLPALSRTGADGKTMYLHDERDAIDWWKHATVANQPYLAPDAALPVRRREDFVMAPSDDLLVDVRRLVERLAAAQLEVLVLDQTRSDVGLSVVKTLVPGLRHFWRRLGPGRLYDVPVTLGWLAEPRREEDLNPYSMFF